MNQRLRIRLQPPLPDGENFGKTEPSLPEFEDCRQRVQFLELEGRQVDFEKRGAQTILRLGILKKMLKNLLNSFFGQKLDF